MVVELSLDNPVFGSFAFYGTLTLCKMALMAVYTGIARMKAKVSKETYN